MYLTLIPSNLSRKRECGPKRVKYRFSTALYRNVYLTLIPSNLSPQRDCGPKRVTYRFSTALYRNMYLTLIPSNLCPQRDYGPKRVEYRFSTALYRNMYLTLIPSNLSPQRDCGPKLVNDVDNQVFLEIISSCSKVKSKPYTYTTGIFGRFLFLASCSLSFVVYAPGTVGSAPS